MANAIMDKYRQTKTCAQCGHENERWLDEHRAAFDELSKLSDWYCAQCGSTKISAACKSSPPLTHELLLIWAADDNLHFHAQDEELWPLGDPEKLPLLLEVVDRSDLSDYKRATLLSALLVIAFDIVEDEDEAGI